MSEEESKVQSKALGFLSRREYSEKELKLKLMARGCDKEIAESVVARLKQENLVCDVRFAKALVNVRIRRGYGPRKISSELLDRGVEIDVVNELLQQRNGEWESQIAKVIQNKYGEMQMHLPDDWVKRANFLRRRGFTLAQIQSVLGANSDYEDELAYEDG